MKFKQCIQIGRSVEGIFRLPCVVAIRKDIFGAAFFDTYGFIMDDGKSVSAREGDWLCENYNGHWKWFTNEEYKLFKENQDGNKTSD